MTLNLILLYFVLYLYLHLIYTMQEVKTIKSHYLYNMLQDFRHIVVFDLRN